MKVMNRRFVQLARTLSPMWDLLGWILRRGGKKHIGSPPKSILIFDFHLIGDIVLLTPLLSALRDGYPDARIVLVAGPWAADVLLGSDLVDEIIPFSAPWVKYGQGWRGLRQCLSLVRRLRRERWDLGIEVRGDIRQILLLCLGGAVRRVGYDFTGGGALLTDVVVDDGAYAHLADHHQRIGEHLGIWPLGREYQPFLRLTDEEQARANAIQPYIGFHFGASLPLRRLPSNEIKELLGLWQNSDLPLICFMPPDHDDEVQKSLDALPPAFAARVMKWTGSLRDFIVTASRAKRLYLMDSGPAHIATALGVQVTVFYGPAESEYVRPVGDNVSVVQKPVVPCRPCDQIRCVHPRYHYCMEGLASMVKVPSQGVTDAKTGIS